jgi:hypothetical protein
MISEYTHQPGLAPPTSETIHTNSAGKTIVSKPTGTSPGEDRPAFERTISRASKQKNPVRTEPFLAEILRPTERFRFSRLFPENVKSLRRRMAKKAEAPGVNELAWLVYSYRE